LDQIRLFLDVDSARIDFATLDSALCFAMNISFRYPHLFLRKDWFGGFLQFLSRIVHSTTSASSAGDEQFRAVESCLLVITRTMKDAVEECDESWIAFAVENRLLVVLYRLLFHDYWADSPMMRHLAAQRPIDLIQPLEGLLDIVLESLGRGSWIVYRQVKRSMRRIAVLEPSGNFSSIEKHKDMGQFLDIWVAHTLGFRVHSISRDKFSKEGGGCRSVGSNCRRGFDQYSLLPSVSL
jgi:hypothetical protein